VVEKGLVIFFASDRIGRGDDELGGIVARTFFHVLGDAARIPEAIIFMNAGVKLAAEGSPVVESLAALQSKGVRILSCGTCCDWFKVKDRIRAGLVSNMHDIQETLLAASKVVSM